MSLHKGGRVNKWTEEELGVLERLYHEGIPYAKIATQMSRSCQSVQRKIQERFPDLKRTSSNDPKIIAAVIAGYNTGETYQVISDRLGINRQTVRRILQHSGLKKRKKYDVAKHKSFSPELVDKVKDLYLDQNLTLAETAKRLNIKYNLINSIVASRGLRKKPEDWSENEFKTLFSMLERGDSLLKMCYALNKTDIAIRGCAKYFDLYEKHPVLHSYLSKEERGQIRFVVNKLTHTNRYDDKYFHATNLRIADVFEMFEKQNGRCFYTGRKLEFRSNCEDTMSIDRIDSEKPHSKDNIVLCSWEANMMKQDLDIEKFLTTAQEIASRAQIIRDSVKELSRLNQQEVAEHSHP